MWGYLKKVIEYIIFSLLLEAVVIVAKLSCEGIIDGIGKGFDIALFVIPAVMASIAVLSLVRIHRKRSGSRYEKEPISIVALVILSIVAIVGVISAAITINMLAGYLYSI